jgi:hypothetical protein
MNDRLKRKRKFIMALLCWAGATAGMLLGKLGGAEYVTTLALTLGLYGGANVGKAWVDKNGGK